MEFSALGLLIYGLPLLLAIPLHEAAHGWAAWKLGDPTAKYMGRVTFNPIKHIDPVGTIALPVLLILSGIPFVFGWAKPVPVNFALLHKPRRDSALVAAAGPAVNIVLALLSALALRLLFDDAAFLRGDADWWAKMLVFSLFLNLALAIFNLMPILPMDGGRILNSFLPRKASEWYSKSERYGMTLPLAIFVIPTVLGTFFGQNWSIFSHFLAPFIQKMAIFMLEIVGFS
ncbi:MAG: site-2 protease family protein [Alphaproteobacteria bacterium]|nr:site-2 protease family protein [Alphaproteobacteria bacterium]